MEMMVEKQSSELRITSLPLYLLPLISWSFSHTHRLWPIASISVSCRLQSQSGHIRCCRITTPVAELFAFASGKVLSVWMRRGQVRSAVFTMTERWRGSLAMQTHDLPSRHSSTRTSAERVPGIIRRSAGGQQGISHRIENHWNEVSRASGDRIQEKTSCNVQDSRERSPVYFGASISQRLMYPNPNPVMCRPILDIAFLDVVHRHWMDDYVLLVVVSLLYCRCSILVSFERPCGQICILFE